MKRTQLNSIPIVIIQKIVLNIQKINQCIAEVAPMQLVYCCILNKSINKKTLLLEKGFENWFESIFFLCVRFNFTRTFSKLYIQYSIYSIEIQKNPVNILFLSPNWKKIFERESCWKHLKSCKRKFVKFYEFILHHIKNFHVIFRRQLTLSFHQFCRSPKHGW